jgi:hypothetical protein
MSKQPPLPDGVLVSDLLSDLVSAVVAADRVLEETGESFVIPSAKVSAEFVVGFDREKRRGFLLWARSGGSHEESRASVELSLVAAPPKTGC